MRYIDIDKNDASVPLEGCGFWIEMPGIMPIGTILWFKWPDCYENDEIGFSMEIEKYEIRVNGDIICRLDSTDRVDRYLEFLGSREEILEDMGTVGLVDYYANERAPNATLTSPPDA